MLRRAVIVIVLGCSTLLFGTLAIVACLVIPNGNPLLWMARPWARCILWAAGTRVRAGGLERLPPGRPVIFVANHQSYFDILALIRALPGQYRVIAKKELFSIPVFGWALSVAGFIKIDRSDREKAAFSLQSAAAKIRKGLSIVVFAEGTRSADGSLLPFKKGGFLLAIENGCPIVPVSLSGSRAVMPKDSLDVRPGLIDVVIGEPIDPAAYTFETRGQLIAATRRAIEAGFTPLKALDAPAAKEPERILQER
jgi:1-acyl-sn-glycerol-3-phosphate acyltransferase